MVDNILSSRLSLFHELSGNGRMERSQNNQINLKIAHLFNFRRII